MIDLDVLRAACDERIRRARVDLLRAQGLRYRVLEVSGERCIQLGCCGRISFNANDIEQRYCGACHIFLFSS